MDDAILLAFLAESWDHVSVVRTELDAIDTNPTVVAGPGGRIVEALGAIHTGGTFLGLNVLAALAHRTAERVTALRSPAAAADVQTIRSGVDGIVESLSTLEAIGEETILADEDALSSEVDATEIVARGPDEPEVRSNEAGEATVEEEASIDGDSDDVVEDEVTAASPEAEVIVADTELDNEADTEAADDAGPVLVECDDEAFVTPPPPAEPREVAAIANLLRRAVSIPPALEWTPESTAEEVAADPDGSSVQEDVGRALLPVPRPARPTPPSVLSHSPPTGDGQECPSHEQEAVEPKAVEPVELAPVAEAIAEGLEHEIDEVTVPIEATVEPVAIDDVEEATDDEPVVEERTEFVINEDTEPAELAIEDAPGRLGQLVGELSGVRDDLVELALDCDDERFDGPVSRLDRVATELADAVTDPQVDHDVEGAMETVAPVPSDERSDDTMQKSEPAEAADASTETVESILETDATNSEAFVVPFVAVEPVECRTALVVDDSLFYRELVGATLVREEFVVTGVADAGAAVALLDEGRRFDVVVCHVSTPEALALAGVLREREGNEATLCLATSAPGPAVVERTTAAGWDGWMERFRAGDLAAAVTPADAA